MRLLHFLSSGSPRLGACRGDDILDLTSTGLPATVDNLLRLDGWLDAAREAALRAPVAGTRSSVSWLPPVLAPAKAIAAGLNYRDHASETRHEAPAHPVLFHRYPSSWVGHGHAILRPRVSDAFDYEAELVAVIGRGGRAIPVDRALAHVAGYSLFNDGSVRDRQTRTSQWMLGKNFDRSGGFGPELVTADELPPGAAGLDIVCRLNGQAVQSANTRDMLFPVAQLVSACSEAMELAPGDVIITGTPAGVGAARKPPLWMRPGDVCEVEVQGIGVLRNPVAQEGDA